MNVLLLAAVSADGLIARHQHELADWTSKEDKKLFVQLTKQAGVIIMGGNTFRTIGKALPGRRIIVYSRQSELEESGVEVTAEAPAQLLARLGQEGAQAVVICGGQTIYTMFLTAGLVDELYLTVEPTLFGQGLTLADSSLDLPLRLADHRLLNESTVLLHYEVIKYGNSD